MRTNWNASSASAASSAKPTRLPHKAVRILRILTAFFMPATKQQAFSPAQANFPCPLQDGLSSPHGTTFPPRFEITFHCFRETTFHALRRTPSPPRSEQLFAPPRKHISLTPQDNFPCPPQDVFSSPFGTTFLPHHDPTLSLTTRDCFSFPPQYTPPRDNKNACGLPPEAARNPFTVRGVI